MKTYKVYEVEDKVSGKGNAYKKLVLQSPDEKFPLKNVTMFASHPLFEEIAPGQTVQLDIEVKDSTTPNPHGGFYKNRTVLNPGQTPKAEPKQTQTNGQPTSTVTLADIKNAIVLGVIPELKKIHKELVIKNERDMGLDPDAIDEAFNKNAQKDDIQEEDNPF